MKLEKTVTEIRCDVCAAQIFTEHERLPPAATVIIDSMEYHLCAHCRPALDRLSVFIENLGHDIEGGGDEPDALQI